jgi:hypothetical protein
MSSVVLALSLLAFGSGAAAASSCSPEVVSAVVAEATLRCPCCPRAGRCAKRLVRRAVAEHRLSRGCGPAVRGAVAAACRRVRVECRLGQCPAVRPCRVLRWRPTCGDPVCGGVEPPNGLPCTAAQVVNARCSVPGERCDPGASCNALLVCSANRLDLQCPISRRALKEDITYVDPAAAARLHDELMRLPVATWRDRGDASGARRLGFVIEDVAPSAAVAADGTHVDLYGYVSMAVAALQVQARELSGLRAEVASLRRALAAPCRR